MRSASTLGLLAALVVLAVLGWRHWAGSNATKREDRTSTGVGSAPPAPGNSAAPSRTPEPTKVRRLTRDERRRLGEQLAAALAVARQGASTTASGGTAAAAPADPIIPLEDAGPALQEALVESVALLAACYPQQPGSGARHATALMVMTSDPELGTVIDTDRVTDGDGTPLDPALATCLRDTIDTLALPPLAKLGKLPLQYTFTFD